MPQLSPDQFDDCLGRALVQVEYREDEESSLDPRLALLHEINEELSKDGGQAGTHAYEMLAAAEEINAGNTAVLMELVAAVVMWKLGETLVEQLRPLQLAGPILADPLSVEFTPQDIDDMQRTYQIDAKRDGMLLTVTLTRREKAAASWLSDDETPDGAKPQAMPPDRPQGALWAVVDTNGTLHGMPSRATAESFVRDNEGYSVQNRHCYHQTCPNTRCMAPEVTSHA